MVVLKSEVAFNVAKSQPLTFAPDLCGIAPRAVQVTSCKPKEPGRRTRCWSFALDAMEELTHFEGSLQFVICYHDVRIAVQLLVSFKLTSVTVMPSGSCALIRSHIQTARFSAVGG